jgi:UPF0755 protein
LSRPVKAILIILVMLVFGAVLCGGGLLVISNGQPGDFIQTAMARFRLSSRENDLNRSISSDTTPVRFTIASGDTARDIGAKLIRSGLIRDADLFVDFVRANDIDSELEAGTYFLNHAQNVKDIAQALTDSRSSQFPFRILEGWRMEEIAEIIDTNPYFGFTGSEFLAVVLAGAPQDPQFAQMVGLPPGASMEGFLFPETYELPAVVTPVMLRDILTRQFTQEIGSDIPAQARQQGLSLYEVVTLASIVQREGVHPDEYPRIASVYRNRMDMDMKLDADPTVQYGIGLKNGQWWPSITQDDYTQAVSPYNTYLNVGLPPGPIANPGIDAIRAAVNPEETPYLYFRAACDGSGYHKFAVTFEEHVANECS